LNWWKGNTLLWRWRAEGEIRSSGLDYSIVRVGVLFSRPAGWRAVHVTQDEMPLSISTRLARADAAEVIAAALHHTAAARATFEVIGTGDRARTDWRVRLGQLRPDPPSRAH
jgi:hypothetical protein